MMRMMKMRMRRTNVVFFFVKMKLVHVGGEIVEKHVVVVVVLCVGIVGVAFE